MVSNQHFLTYQEIFVRDWVPLTLKTSHTTLFVVISQISIDETFKFMYVSYNYFYTI